MKAENQGGGIEGKGGWTGTIMTKH